MCSWADRTLSIRKSIDECGLRQISLIRPVIANPLVEEYGWKYFLSPDSSLPLSFLHLLHLRAAPCTKSSRPYSIFPFLGRNLAIHPLPPPPHLGIENSALVCSSSRCRQDRSTELVINPANSSYTSESQSAFRFCRALQLAQFRHTARVGSSSSRSSKQQQIIHPPSSFYLAYPFYRTVTPDSFSLPHLLRALFDFFAAASL